MSLNFNIYIWDFAINDNIEAIDPSMKRIVNIHTTNHIIEPSNEKTNSVDSA